MNEPPRLWQLGRLTPEMEFRPLICVEAPSAVEAVAKGREEYPGINGALAVQEVDCDDVAGEWESLIAAAAASLAELRGFEHRNGLVSAGFGDAPAPHHAATCNRLRDAGLSDGAVAAELEGRFGPVRVTPSHADAIGTVGKGITLDPTL